MTQANLKDYRLGWIGTGRMGHAMASRLLKNGCDVAVYNRTRAKAESLAEFGAAIVDSPPALADRDIVFTMVSGNAKVVKAGLLSVVAAGPEAQFKIAEPYLALLGRGVSYVGEGELARMVKICHNILLGVVTQSLAEITVLAEKGGVPRHAFLDFINKSVMGSLFTKYKSPAFVNLDWTPTFTPYLLRKDLDLGLEAGRNLGVPQPLTALTRELVQGMIGNGYAESDFGALLVLEAKAAGLELKSENKKLDDGLSGKS